VVAGGTLSRRFGPGLTASLGVASIAEQILQEGRLDDYLLLQVPIAVTYDSTNDPLDPASGLRATVSLTPTTSFGSTGTQTFMIAQVAASAYLDFGTSGRSVLALRGLVGASQGASTFSLPPDQRFYAGGSGTVRGFRYQSIGPQFAFDRPTGGTAVDAGSVEFRQRIGADWGAAAFVDAGQISDAGVPFQGTVEVGAGVGVRYYSAIGPLRFDIAVPLTRMSKGDAFELYIGIGQAF
jgi:translocation and assembly module TamA